MKRIPPPVRSVLLVGIVVAFVLAAASADRAAADPSFGLDSASPSPIGPYVGGGPGQVLDPFRFGPVKGTTPLPRSFLPVMSLGPFAPIDGTDDISYGDDCYPASGGGGLCPPSSSPALYLPFSVDRAAVGMPGPPPSVSSEASPPELAAAADVFTNWVPSSGACGLGPFMPNRQIIDGDGLVAGGAADGVGLGLDETTGARDNLDSLEMKDRTFVDPVPPRPGFDGLQEGPVYFTLDAATALTYGVSAANIYVSGPPITPPGVIQLWAPFGALGLAFFDNIDALAVGDQVPAPFSTYAWAAPIQSVIFSLTPGSPSLATLPRCNFFLGPGTSGDLWYTPVPGLAVPLHDAEELGLQTLRSGGTNNDNLDAVDVVWGVGSDTDGDGLDNAIDPDDDNDGVGDGAEIATGCNPLVTDTDGEGLNDFNELITYGTKCWVRDTDGDSCSDAEEVPDIPSPPMPPPRPVATGNYDPLDWYDFYDVPVPCLRAGPGIRNGAITLADVVSVLCYVGQGSTSPAYLADVNLNGILDGLEYDRSPSLPPNPPADAGPPNGAITIADVLIDLAQVGLRCTG